MNPRKIIIAVAFFILWSMALHASVPHHHPPKIFGDGVQAFMHGEDRKLWQLLLALGVILFSFCFSLFSFYSATRRFSVQPVRGNAACAEPIRTLFSRGILHPKLCG